MTESQINNYLENEVIWESKTPINICYDNDRTENIIHKLNNKFSSNKQLNKKGKKSKSK